MTKRGFTLIELLIVIGIILLFSGLSLASYNNFNEEKKLDEETSKLVNVLNTARKKATVNDLGNFKTTCPDNFQGYVTRVLSSTSYQLEFCCHTDQNCPQSPNNDPKIIQQYNLPTSFTLNPSSGSILFRRLTSGALFNNDINQSSLRITVKNSGLNPAKCVPIDIASSGLITENAKTTSCP